MWCWKTACARRPRAARLGLAVAAAVLLHVPANAQTQSPDRPALVALHQALDGPNWTGNTNWLSQAPVDTWFGVTASMIGGYLRVTAIDLGGNNLSGTLPTSLGADLLGELLDLNLADNRIQGSVPTGLSTISLPKLQFLTLSRNLLDDLSGLSQSETFLALNVENNFLTFEDLEPLVGHFSIHFAPQEDVGQGGQIVVNAGDSFQLHQAVGGTANQYQWYFNHNAVSGETSDTLVRTSATSAGDAGEYFLAITNTIVTGFTLRTPVFTVTVDDPVVGLPPTAVEFGSVRVGVSSSMSATLQNTGTGTLNPSSFSITGANAADFSLTAGGTTDPLGPGEQRILTVEFAPGGTGARTASLVLSSNAPGSPHAVSLLGTGTEPGFGVSPASISFSDTDVGSSQDLVATISNTGSTTMTITGFQIEGTHATDFDIVAGNTPRSLDPQQTHALTLRFSPAARGPRSAMLTVDDDAPGNPHQVTLDGTGLAPPFTLDPDRLDFGDTAVGGRQTRQLIVRNESPIDMEILSVELQPKAAGKVGPFSISGGSQAGTLAPLEERTVEIAFEPTAAGPETATLVVSGPDQQSQADIQGNGVSQALDVDPGSVDFGGIELGQSSDNTVRISNVGTATVVLTSVVATGDPDFVVTSGGQGGALQPGETRDTSIRFTPAQTGTRNAELVISSDAPDSPTVVPLEGQGTQAGASVSPTALDFGGVVVPGSTDLTFTLQSTGTARLHIADVQLSGDAVFEIVDPNPPAMIDPGESHTFTVRYRPDDAGDHAGTISLGTNAPDSPHTITLAGSATIITAEVTPQALDFGAVGVGASSTMSVTVENTGTAPLEIMTLELTGDPDFQLTGGASPGSLQPGETRVIQVTFAPSLAGPRNAQLSATTNAPGSPHSIPISGTGTSATVELSPQPIEFGAAEVGSSVERTATLQNTGPVPVEIVSMALTGHPDFRLLAGGTAGTLAVGAGRLVQLGFVPQATGDRTGQLTIESSASGSPHTVTLTGLGTAPELFASPGGLNFSDIEVGSAADLEVTIENRGTAPLELVGFQLTGDPDFELVSGGSPATLPPAAMHTLGLRFTPTVPGQRSGVLAIASNAPGSPHSVPMIGTGTAAELTTHPGTLGFGQIQVGSSADLSAEIRNSGTAPLQVTSISVSGAAFSLVAGAQTGTLGPDESLQVEVRFEPAARGTASGSLDIASNAGSASVTTTGTGIGPALELDPIILAFGSVEVGVPRTGATTVRNVGEIEATISLTIAGPDAAAFVASIPVDTVPAGQTSDVSVVFQPIHEGGHAATIDVGGNSVGPPPQLSLTGTGAAPSIIGTDPGSVSAAAGSDVPLTAQLPVTFQPEVRELCFRLTGVQAFECVPLVQDGTSHLGLLPADFVTERGVDYYFRFEQGGSLFTDPPVDAESNPYRLRVAVPAIASPFPVVPGLYGMFSVPLVLDDPTADAVLAPFGPPDPLRWRLLRWNPEFQRYDEHPAQPLTFEPCEALWFISDGGSGLQFGQGTSVDPLDPCRLVLLPGWNQIGNPYAFPILWADVELSGPLDLPVGFDPVGPGQDPYAYNQEVLLPWGGYWVNNPGTTPVQAAFSPVETTTTAGKDHGVETANKGQGPLGATYTLRLIASMTDEGLVDSQNYVGFSPDASDEYDAIDFAEAPGIGDFVRLSVLSRGRRMAGEFRATTEGGALWDLEIGSSLASGRLRGGRRVRVQLDEIGDPPPGFEAVLLDRDMDRRIPLVAGGFEVVLTPALPTRRVGLIVGTSAFASGQRGDISLLPQEAALGAIYPNPARSSVRILYQISESGGARLVVFDSLGRRVRTLLSSDARPGWLEAEWDGRDDSGQRVSSGLYFVQLQANATVSTRQLVLLR